jgi:cyanophycin synthetase
MFDELIFRERPDGRGRANGSVVSLLTEGAIGRRIPGGPDPSHPQ